MPKLGERKSKAVKNIRDMLHNLLQHIKSLRYVVISCFLVVTIFIASNIIPKHDGVGEKFEAITFKALSNISEFVSKIHYLFDDHNIIRKENKALKRQIYQIAQLQSENKALRALLNFKESRQIKTITVRVIGHDYNFLGMNLMINAGSDDGILDEALVFNQDGVIGRVVEVKAKISRVMTIYDPNSRIPVLLSYTGRRAMLGGNAKTDGSLPLRYLEDEHYFPDEVAITSDDGNILPPGFYVGDVTYYKDEIRVIPRIRWKELNYALVCV